MDRTARDGSKQHLDGLTAASRSCGVTLKEQGREQLKWTSFTCDGRKKVMKVHTSLTSMVDSTDTAIKTNRSPTS